MTAVPDPAPGGVVGADGLRAAVLAVQTAQYEHRKVAYGWDEVLGRWMRDCACGERFTTNSDLLDHQAARVALAAALPAPVVRHDPHNGDCPANYSRLAVEAKCSCAPAPVGEGDGREIAAEAIEEACMHPAVMSDGSKRFLGGYCDQCAEYAAIARGAKP